jgi:hypothetical protein
VVSVFGQPSDIDGNDRILILFTPRVNALTPRGAGSFVAGYFYGCDLLSRSRCSGTNRAEIFYSMVPDPGARWGDARSLPAVMASVPPVLAHEVQHMIHFARRGYSSDVLWLSEALAHTAEELVGDVLADRGLHDAAEDFFTGNSLRAAQYLVRTRSTSLIAEEMPGTLAVRGGGWLLLRYLRGHYGGDGLLDRLTASTRTGVDNITAETGMPWREILADFGIALWAHDAPGLSGTLEDRHRFVGPGPREFVENQFGNYPLQVPLSNWDDFSTALRLPASSQGYVRVAVPADGAPGPLNFVLSGSLGAPMGAADDVALSILRIR